jgi:hypothetical protein
MVAEVRYSVAGWSRGRVTPCVVCTVHIKTRSVCFLVEPQNQGLRFVGGLALKPLGRFVIGLASNPRGRLLLVWPQNRWWRVLLVLPQNRWLRVSQLGPQNWQLWFGDLGLKITVTISWFEPQNHVDDGLKVALQNQWREESMGHASRSGSLFHLETCCARVF